MKAPAVRGLVIEALPNLQYKIKLADDKEVIGYTSGKMRINNIKLVIGDSVDIVLDQFGGKTTNRIIKRL